MGVEKVFQIERPNETVTSVGEMQDDETDLSSASGPPVKRSKQGVIIIIIIIITVKLGANDSFFFAQICASEFFQLMFVVLVGRSPCRCS